MLRLGYRVRKRMFWVEDMWAIVALMCGVVIESCCTCNISYVSRMPKASLTPAWIYAYTDGQSSIIYFWAYSLTFPSTVWAVRPSILFSLARIFWSTKPLRFMTYIIALVFLVFYSALIIQKA
ncbi:hypothetical protein K503DRAFT_735296 [Rhizopogon vinicolor AM-OR11-026]|uniref:Rhodopsin domain-containing protein n=1 Tax=Rhizopogon vinicolor AM-OR11-026 TaxID=1314800 RepID=A0A1B7N9Q7_9AGAM|nr:hypothetical protein K503DRAFT_735296 [Rhizopogon vinicolor AM-OR11-026]